MKRKVQVNGSGQPPDNPAERRNEHFAKFAHPLWDLGLVRDHLKTVDDLLVFLCMLRYADFEMGECAVFIPRIMRETGIKHATQVKRCMERVARMGAFWRPEGTRGFKKIYGKSVRRYFRATGKEIIAHALENDLVGEDTLREIEVRQVEKETEAEAQEAIKGGGNTASVGQPRSIGGLEDEPETLDEVMEQIRKGNEE